jgi:hypothetical protein
MSKLLKTRSVSSRRDWNDSHIILAPITSTLPRQCSCAAVRYVNLRSGLSSYGSIGTGNVNPRLTTPSATLVVYRRTLGFSCIMRDIKAS